MTIDPERLLHFSIPDVRHTLTERDTILYALGIGLGQDPMDDRQLDYVGHRPKLHAMPCMPVVLAHPGFWLGNPATGVDALRVVHGEQEVEILQPLPVAGELIGRTRVTGLVDKGAGRGALLYSEKQLVAAESGELFAITRATTFLRGDGGFGGEPGPTRPTAPAPAGEPDALVDLATRPEQALLYSLNGDDNPLHTDPATAARAGFPRPILHGLCTLGVVTHALLRELGGYDARQFRFLSMRFSAPVFPGETIRTEIWRDGGFRARVLERDIVVVNNGRVEIAA